MEDRRGAGAASVGAAGRGLGTGSRRCCVGGEAATWRGWYWCFLLAACLAAPEVSAAPLSALSGAGHDGTTRLTTSCPPTPQEGATTRSSTGNGGNTGSTTTVAAFYDAQQAASGWSERILEEAAQALESRGVNFIKVDLQKCRQTSGDATPGSVVIYQNRKYEYRGLHTSQALVSFVLKVSSDPVTVIQSKSHKKAFEKVEGPKLAALLEPGTPGLAEFERAAAALHPYVSCHVVPDAKMVFDAKDPGGALKNLKSKPQGTIAYYAPYEETPEFLPEGKADEILRFFSEGQPSFLRRLYPHDLYATMDAYSSSLRLVLALLLPRSPEGLALYKTLRRLTNRDNISDLKVNVLYVNVEDFPMNIGALEKEFGVDLAKPAMGLINITTGDAVWFTKPDLHLLDKEEQTGEVTNWLKRVADGKIKVDGTKVTEETETKEKDDKTETKEDLDNAVQEDGDFKPKTDKEDEDDEDDKTDKDQEKEQATSDDDDGDDKDNKDDDDDDDDDDEGDSKAGVYKSPPIHQTAGHKQSAYMRQFNDGDKVFSNVFSAVLSPFRSLFGSGESSEQQVPASPKHTQPETPSKPEKLKVKAKSQPKHKETASGKHVSGKKDTYCDESDKVFASIFKFVMKTVGMGDDAPAAAKPDTASKSKAHGEAAKEPVQHTHRAVKSKEFKSSEDDKLLTNLFKGIYKILSLPFNCIFGGSSTALKESPAPQEPVKHHVEQNGREIKSSDYAGTDSDKLLSNLFKLVFSPVTNLVNSLQGEAPAESATKAAAAKPQVKQTTKPSQPEKTSPPEEKKPVEKAVKQEAAKPRKRDPREPMQKQGDWQMPDYGGEDDKIFATIFKSAVNLVTGGGGGQKQDKAAPTKPADKVKQQAKSKPKAEKPKEEPKKETLVKKLVQEKKKAAQHVRPAEEKRKVPAGEAHKSPETKKPGDQAAKSAPAKEDNPKKAKRFKVPETKLSDDEPLPAIKPMPAYGGDSDKLITSIVKAIFGSASAEAQPQEAKSKPLKKAPEPKTTMKTSSAKVGDVKAAKSAPAKEDKPKKVKRFKVPETKLSDDEPLPAIKPMPAYGGDSDKLITSIVKAIFGSASAEAQPQEAKSKPLKKAPEPKITTKTSSVKVGDVKEHGKPQMPSYGEESDKLISGMVKAVVGLGKDVVSKMTAHGANAEDAGKSSKQTPSKADSPPKQTQQKEPVQKASKAPAKPKKVFKPVPVPSFKHEETSKSQKDSKYINKFKSNPEDKLLTYMFKLIVSTVTGGSPASHQDDEDGDSLKAVVSNIEQVPEPEEDDKDNIPKADVLNSIFNEESYGKDLEVPKESEPKAEDVVKYEKMIDEAKVDEAEERLSQNEFLEEAFKEQTKHNVSDTEKLKDDEKTEENEIPEYEPKTIPIEVNNDDDDDDDDNNQAIKDDDTADTMSTEDFINMAFTEEETKKDEFFVDGDDDDDVHDDDDDDNDDDDEKNLNYRPFSSDPRKQFHENLHVEDQKDESLYEHGKAYDRHRQGEKHL